MDPSTLIKSSACRTWKELHRQKLRWFTGGRDMDVKSLAIFAIPYILNLLILAGLFVFSWQPLLLALGAKLAVDCVLLLPALVRFRRLHLIRSFPLFELYYFFYVLLYPPLVLLGGRVIWKERSF